MKDAVLIKSFTNGITLLMREDASLEEILQELAVKFTEAKNFFGSSTMALSMPSTMQQSMVKNSASSSESVGFGILLLRATTPLMRNQVPIHFRQGNCLHWQLPHRRSTGYQRPA